MAYDFPKESSLQEKLVGNLMQKPDHDFQIFPTSLQSLQEIHAQWQSGHFQELKGQIDTFTLYPCHTCSWTTYFFTTTPKHHLMLPENSLCTSCNKISHCGVYACKTVTQNADYCVKHSIHHIHN